MTTVTLSTPLIVNKQPVTSLTFRKARLADLIAADSVKGELSKTAAVLASMSGVSYPEFKEIDMDDMNTIIAQVGHLLGNGDTPQTTGEA